MATRGLGESLHKKRLFLEKQLMDVGFRVLPAQGTYFLVADFRYVRGRFTCCPSFSDVFLLWSPFLVNCFAQLLEMCNPGIACAAMDSNCLCPGHSSLMTAMRMMCNSASD